MASRRHRLCYSSPRAETEDKHEAYYYTCMFLDELKMSDDLADARGQIDEKLWRENEERDDAMIPRAAYVVP